NFEWYDFVINENDLIHWYYIKNEPGKNYNYLSLVRKINFPEYKTSGILVIKVNTNELNKILLQETAPTLLIDKYNNIITSNYSEYIGKNLIDIVDFKQTNDIRNGVFEGLVNKE